MQKLIGSILILVAMFYASFTEAIGTDRDLNTAIITAKQITTPPNPASGFQRIYCKSDEKCYTLNSAGEETELGSGGAADFKELMTDPSFEELTDEGVCVNCTATLVPSITTTPFNVNRLSLVFSAAGTYTVDKTTGDGFFGLPSNVECEVSTTNSDIDFAHRSNGANVATVDVDAVAIASGAGATTEVTRALKSNVIGTTSEGFQIIAGSAGEVILDNCTVSTKQVLSSIGADSDLTEYTPSTQGFGTLGTSSFRYARSGSFLLLYATFTVGTTVGTEAQVSLPTGLTIGDVGITGQASNVGSFVTSENGTENGGVILATTGDTFINFSARSIFGTNPNIGNLPVGGSAVISTGVVTLNARIPIQGWTASFDALSDSAGGSNVKLDTANGYGSTATKIRRFSNQRVNIGSNIEYVDSATDGASFTVKRSGFYFISYIDKFNAASWLGVSLNSANLTTSIDSLTSPEALTASTTSSADAAESVSWVGWLWAGDIVRPHTNGTAVSGGAAQTSFSIVGLLDQINAILKDVVMSPGSSNGKPVIYSALRAAMGTVSNEVAEFINGNCTNANPSVCSFNSGTWVSEPNCICMATTNTNFCNIQNTSTSSIDVYINDNVGASTLSTVGAKIICHGVRP